MAQRVLSTIMGYTYPNQKGNYYYRNHTLYHIGTLDPLGGFRVKDLGVGCKAWVLTVKRKGVNISRLVPSGKENESSIAILQAPKEGDLISNPDPWKDVEIEAPHVVF